MVGTTLPDLELAIVATVAALPAGPYEHGGLGESWHESLQPLQPIYDPESLGHLAFSVFTESSPAAPQGMQERYRSGEALLVESQVSVVFCYRLRPETQVADYRMAQRAALDVVAAVNALGVSTTVHCAVRPVERFSPLWQAEGQWLMVRTTFILTHHEQV